MINANEKKRLGDILVSAGIISIGQLDNALKMQIDTGKRIGEILISQGIVSEQIIIDTISSQLGIEIVDLDKVFIDQEAARSIPKEVAKKYLLVPFLTIENELHVAMSDPMNLYAIDDLRFITKKQVRPYITKRNSIEKAIEIYYNKQTTDRALEDLKKEYNLLIDEKIDPSVLDEIQSAPAVRLANSIISQAVNMRASDIHIEPFEKTVSVRYRVDGVLTTGVKIPQNLYSAVSTRIKIMAGVNIAERRLPQDGRIEMEIGNKPFDFRVSTLPTVFGEKIVIRILDRSSFVIERDRLGFTRLEEELVDKIMRAPYGMVLVTGPTGSGKSTTLYSMLRELNVPDKNLVTVEDPVEYMLEGINQVQVNNKAGLTFAAGLRSILRQDPDVIMIGEIRDEETAEIAIRGSITGHLVLSTLHTNDAPGSIARLLDMGIEPYLVADSVIAVIAQRLIRTLCNACKEQYVAENWEENIIKQEEIILLHRAKGCPLCNNTGYIGRKAIHEIMLVNNEIRNAIEKSNNAEQLRNIATANGMISLYDNCRRLVINGETTISEMVKTVYVRE